MHVVSATTPCCDLLAFTEELPRKNKSPNCSEAATCSLELLDACTDSRWLSLDRVKYTTVDEADEMIAESWEEHMTHLLEGGASSEAGDHQYMASLLYMFPKFDLADNLFLAVQRHLP